MASVLEPENIKEIILLGMLTGEEKTILRKQKGRSSQNLNESKEVEKIPKKRTCAKGEEREERIRKFLKENEGKEFSNEELADGIGITKEYMYRSIKGFIRKGMLLRVTQGKYKIEASTEERAREKMREEKRKRLDVSTEELELIDTIKQAFYNDENKAIIECMFKRNSFNMGVIKSKFAEEDVCRIVELFDNEVIFESKIIGRYQLSVKWRIWYYLKEANKLINASVIKYELMLENSVFNKAVIEAQKEGLIVSDTREPKEKSMYWIED